MSKLVRMYPIQTDKFSEVRILEKCPSYVDPFRISFFCNFYNSRTIFFLPPINFGNTSKPFQYVSFRQWVVLANPFQISVGIKWRQRHYDRYYIVVFEKIKSLLEFVFKGIKIRLGFVVCIRIIGNFIPIKITIISSVLQKDYIWIVPQYVIFEFTDAFNNCIPKSSSILDDPIEFTF